MKRILTFFVALIATCSLWAGNVITYTATEKLEEETDYYSPGLHTNCFNVSITSHSFSNGIGTITFSGEVTGISQCAFLGCSNLTSITIPNSVLRIGAQAFIDCSGLTSITIPNSVTSIGDQAFRSCSSLLSVTIGNSVTSINDMTFWNCVSLASVSIGNSVASIGLSAFSGCSSLTTINIPNSVTSIESGAFSGCSSLPIENGIRYADTYLVEAVDKTQSTYTIKARTKWIGDHAFFGCSSLTSINIPNSVTSIESGAFSGCSSLTSITIPNFVTSIGSSAFSGCSSLTTINIPNSVTSIGNDVFSGCSNLTSVTLGKAITYIGGEVFYNCTKLCNITCYAPEPPTTFYTFFSNNYNANLYVPCESIDFYKRDNTWGQFKSIQCIAAEESDVTSTTVTSSATEATFAWPATNGASTYTLTITKNGEVVCTLTFNANGQLMNITFAPARNDVAQAQAAELTTTGYQFTVTGLEEGVNYAYTLVAKNADNKTIENYSGTFTTGDVQGFESTTLDQPSQKLIRDGQFLIQRDGKTYNMQGAVVNL